MLGEVLKIQKFSDIEQKRFIYKCKCGKIYKSDSALCNHINIKHKDNKNEFKQQKQEIEQIKRGRRIIQKESQENIPLQNFQICLNVIDQIQITLFFLQKKQNINNKRNDYLNFIDESNLKQYFPQDIFLYQQDYQEIYNYLDNFIVIQKKKFENFLRNFDQNLDYKQNLNLSEVLTKFLVEVSTNITIESFIQMSFFVVSIKYSMDQILDYIKEQKNITDQYKRNLFQIQHRKSELFIKYDTQEQCQITQFIPLIANDYFEIYFPQFIQRLKKQNLTILGDEYDQQFLKGIYCIFCKWLLINKLTDNLPDSKFSNIFKPQNLSQLQKI